MLREALLLWRVEKVHAERDERGEGSGTAFLHVPSHPPRSPVLRVNFGFHAKNRLELGGARCIAGRFIPSFTDSPAARFYPQWEGAFFRDA